MTYGDRPQPIIRTLIAVTCLIGFGGIARSSADLQPAITPYFSHGPSLGRLNKTTISVWARTSQPAAFFVRYGTSDDVLDQTSDIVVSTLERDNTSAVALRDLSPDTRYYYKAVLREHPQVATEVFSFKTLPASEQRSGPLNPGGLFNFAFSATSCAKQSPTQGQARRPHEVLHREASTEVDFHIALGDWLYEKDRLTSVEQWFASSSGPGATRPKLVDDVPTLPGAWQNYKSYLESDESLSRWHASVPSLFLFDDHEILNNFQDSTVIGHRARNALFRDPGLRAWQDYLGWANPGPDASTIHFGRASLRAGDPELHDLSADFNALAFGPERTLHVHWGGQLAGYRNTDASNRSQLDAAIDSAGPVDRNAAVYRIDKVIDEHTLELEPPPSYDSQSTYSIGGLKYFFSWELGNVDVIGLDTRSRRRSLLTSTQPTMLGEEQMDWLKERLSESDADFVFLLSSVSVVIPHVSGAPPNTDDQSWSGYPKERAELLELLESSGKTVIIVTGDLHNAYSIRISDSIWEFAVGPIGALNRTVGEDRSRFVGANGIVRQGDLSADIRWGTWYHRDTPPSHRRTPTYTVFQVNNVFNSPDAMGNARWVAYQRPQVVVQFYHASTGELLYAESVLLQARENE